MDGGKLHNVQHIPGDTGYYSPPGWRARTILRTLHEGYLAKLFRPLFANDHNCAIASAFDVLSLGLHGTHTGGITSYS